MPITPKRLPDRDEIREHFNYNPETGDFIRSDGYYGHINKWGYLIITFGEDYYSHRLIWKYMTGEDPDQIDHINGDRVDNRWINLRNVTHAQNGLNQRKKKDNTSGYTGVSYHRREQKYQSYVHIKGNYIQIGSYNCPTKAYVERQKFLSEFHPNHFHQNHGK